MYRHGFRHTLAIGAEKQKSTAGPAGREWPVCFALFFLVTEL